MRNNESEQRLTLSETLSVDRMYEHGECAEDIAEYLGVDVGLVMAEITEYLNQIEREYMEN